MTPRLVSSARCSPDYLETHGTPRTIRDLPTEVPLDRKDGMPDVCVLSLDNATLVPKAFFRERICALGPERMSEVCRALGRATGCRAS